MATGGGALKFLSPQPASKRLGLFICGGHLCRGCDARFSGLKSALQWMAVTLGAASFAGRNKRGTKFSLEHSLI
jgi:hypothetical protein